MGLLWPERKPVPRAVWKVRFELVVGDGANALSLSAIEPWTITDSYVCTQPNEVDRFCAAIMGDLVTAWERQRRIPKGKNAPKEEALPA